MLFSGYLVCEAVSNCYIDYFRIGGHVMILLPFIASGIYLFTIGLKLISILI